MHHQFPIKTCQLSHVARSCSSLIESNNGTHLLLWFGRAVWWIALNPYNVAPGSKPLAMP